MAQNKSYSLDDLSNVTGFDKRAIRNFIEKGLLRGPDSMGRYARYSEAHLSRLLAIKWMRDNQGMNTQKIRTYLLTMSQDELDIIVAKATSSGIDNSEIKSTALDYIRSISPPKTVFEKQDYVSDLKVYGSTPVDLLLKELSRICNNAPVRKQSKSETWHRISITPDVELSVRGIDDEEQLARMKRVCDYLREILLGGYEDGTRERSIHR